MEDFLGTSIQYSEQQILRLEREHALEMKATAQELIDSGFLDSDWESSCSESMGDTDTELDEAESPEPLSPVQSAPDSLPSANQERQQVPELELLAEQLEEDQDEDLIRGQRYKPGAVLYLGDVEIAGDAGCGWCTWRMDGELMALMAVIAVFEPTCGVDIYIYEDGAHRIAAVVF